MIVTCAIITANRGAIGIYWITGYAVKINIDGVHKGLAHICCGFDHPLEGHCNAVTGQQGTGEF